MKPLNVKENQTHKVIRIYLLIYFDLQPDAAHRKLKELELSKVKFPLNHWKIPVIQRVRDLNPYPTSLISFH